MAEATQISVDDQGCLTLPRDSGEQLGLLPGMTLRVEAERDRLRLRAEPDTARLIRKGSALVIASEPRSDLMDIVQRHREERLAEVMWRGVR